MNRILNFKGDYQGLDSREAAEKLELYGFNSEIKREEHGKFKLYGVFKSPRAYLMIIAAALYYAANNSENNFILKGVLLLLLVVAFCVFHIILEKHCDKKLDEFSKTSDVVVRAVRDGEVVPVRREALVQDDLIILQGGENVPADAHILESTDATADERVFEESSEPVKKHAGVDGKKDGKRELKQSCVYKGTKILSGILIARVFATGQDVKIRPEIRTAREFHRTNTESAINKLSALISCLAGILLVVAAVANLIAAGKEVPEEGGALSFFAETVLPAISFALCVLPMSLALIVRVYYVNGAARLSAGYGNVKSLRAVETLNSVTTACIDIDSVIVSDSTPIVEEISKNKGMLSTIAALSCNTDGSAPDNPYEEAILAGAAAKRINIRELYGNNTLIHSYVPQKQSEYNKISGNLWEVNGSRLLCVKGAPEVVLSFCKLPPDQLFPIQEKQSEYTKQGHHVMAVAFARADYEEEYDENGEVIPYESDYGDGDEDGESANRDIPETLFDIEYTFLGLIAFSATVRTGINQAVKECYRAGVKVIMLSPDASRAGGIETTLAVARKAGIKEDGVIAGKKADVVKSLKSIGDVVAVFGADSSDLEALEAADVGMTSEKHTTGSKWDYGADTLSQFTTGSAYEACDFILEGKSKSNSSSDNNLSKAAGAFRESRQIQRNIRRCITVAVSAFTAILLFGVLNLFIGKDFILEAVFASTLAVITVPWLTLFFLDNEHGLKDGVTPPPIIEPDGKLSGGLLMLGALQGLFQFAGLFVMFLVFRNFEGFTAGMLRSVFLIMFTAGGVATAWVNSSGETPFYATFAQSLKSARTQSGKTTLIFTAALLLSLPLFVYMPFVNSAFGLEGVKAWVFVLSLVVGTVSTVWFDFIKKRY